MNSKSRKPLFNTYILIGGGEAINHSQEQYYLQAIKFAQKKSPRFLYLPFALLKTVSRREIILYTRQLTKLIRSVSPLASLRTILGFIDMKQLRKEIRGADIIYISGGNTTDLIQYFKEVHFVSILKECAKKIIMANSAGVLALSATGLSMEGDNIKKYKGIGIIRGFVPVVHYTKKFDKNLELSSVSTSGRLLLLPENEAFVLTERSLRRQNPASRNGKHTN